MKKKDKKIEKLQPADSEENISTQNNDEAQKNGFPGYPHYPASEDIYNQEKEVDLNTQDLSKVKTQEEPGKRNEKGFREDLDIPGSKTDEAKGNSGNEDEENN